MKQIIIASFCTIALLSTGWGQVNPQAEIRVKDIRAEFDASPRYATQGGQAPQPDSSKKWLKIEAYLESTPEWADDVTVRFYVALKYGANAKDKPKDGFDVLTTVVTIVNMEKNYPGSRKNIVPVFLDANSVKKYDNSNFQDFIIEAAVLVQYKGVLQDTHFMKNQKSDKFWDLRPPRAGVLLNLLQSPWWPAYSEYYEQVKPSGGAPSI